MRKVFVSGCFDMLHSGHVAFFKKAAEYGNLYVGLGSDRTVRELKGRETINSERERLFMIKSVRYVTDAWINRGSGLMDFEQELREFKPDVFVVNEDGNSPAKEALCRELGCEYVVLKRIPEPGLPARSTTANRSQNLCQLPYRLDIAGTWIDQPYVSKYCSGWAITVSLEPVVEYNERSGMATSTRNSAKSLWPKQLPLDKPEKLAELLFRYENVPGKKEISGAQDAIGICVPGISRHYYNKKYWPLHIETIDNEKTISWLEDRLYLVTLWPRPAGLALTENTAINETNVRSLAAAADGCWEGLVRHDLQKFAGFFKKSFEAQIRMFPSMMNKDIMAVIDRYRNRVPAWKLSGAGGGGYLVLVSEKPIEGAMKLKIRRKGSL